MLRNIILKLRDVISMLRNIILKLHDAISILRIIKLLLRKDILINIIFSIYNFIICIFKSN